jgi:hypothetical protein
VRQRESRASEQGEGEPARHNRLPAWSDVHLLMLNQDTLLAARFELLLNETTGLERLAKTCVAVFPVESAK